uniref:F-box domain-containing protein n=1 Tax=Panagrolaimus davidi TaxID=227884 RepID=A0A914PMF5_9BILA
MLTFNTDGMVPQRFPFKDPIMDYIFKNLKPEHLIKLYQCSKYFYAKFRRNIIRHLEIVLDDEEERLDPTRTVITAWNPVLSKLVDFWITDSFIARAPEIRLPEFNHCYIKKLELCDPINWKEYITLTKSGTVEELISIADCLDTSCASLLSMKRKTKFSRFVLNKIMGMQFFNIEMFIEFIVKNVENDCHVHLTFAYPFSRRMAADYTKRIKSALEAKKNADRML